MTECVVPVIDITGFRTGSSSVKRRMAEAVDRACIDIGFLVVTGHGVPEGLIADCFSAMAKFFALDAEVKRLYRAPDGIFRGYYGVGNTALAYSLDNGSPPDLFERFTIGPFDLADDDYVRQRYQRYFPDNIWPAEVAAMRPALEGYYREMERLAGDLMRIFALALDVPETLFATKIDRHISAMSVNHYPAQPEAPFTGQQRAGAHTDYGTLTIVAPTAVQGGLQVLRDGQWHDVIPPPGGFVVNIGDLMAQWTNDRWVSTMHRVANPPREQASNERTSLIFFHQPNEDAVVACLPGCFGPDNPCRYVPTTSGEHLMMKKLKTVR